MCITVAMMPTFIECKLRLKRKRKKKERKTENNNKIFFAAATVYIEKRIVDYFFLVWIFLLIFCSNDKISFFLVYLLWLLLLTKWNLCTLMMNVRNVTMKNKDLLITIRYLCGTFMLNARIRLHWDRANGWWIFSAFTAFTYTRCRNGVALRTFFAPPCSPCASVIEVAEISTFQSLCSVHTIQS